MATLQSGRLNTLRYEPKCQIFTQTSSSADLRDNEAIRTILFLYSQGGKVTSSRELRADYISDLYIRTHLGKEKKAYIHLFLWKSQTCICQISLE